MENTDVWSAETVGRILKKVREERKLTLKEVAERTYIKESFIKALEENDFSRLPARIHINGFISIYAKFLGLDINQVILKLRKQEMLDQETPIDEILNFSKVKSGSSKKRLNPFFLVGVLGLLILFVGSVYYLSPLKEQPNLKEAEVSVPILSDEHPSTKLTLSAGDDFSFKIMNYNFHYKLISFNKEAITLEYNDSKKKIYVLNNEILEHDYNNTYEYGYSLALDRVLSSDKIILKVSLIKVSRDIQQGVFSTVLKKETDVKIDAIELNIKNNIEHSIIIYTVNRDGQELKTKIKPFGSTTINLQLDKNNFLNIQSLYISDLSAVSLVLHGNAIKSEGVPKGAVAYIRFRVPEKNNIKSLTYNVYY